MQQSRGPHRDLTVTGTAGPVGASFAVQTSNWKCEACKAENFARRPKCFRCRAKKPVDADGTVWHEGAANAAAGIDHGWREALDPNTKQIYYFNAETSETRWDRPEASFLLPMS